MTQKNDPDYGVYHSFVDGPGPCPLCSGYNTIKGRTITEFPLRTRYYRCLDCGYNFKSTEIDSRFVVDTYPQIFATLE